MTVSLRIKHYIQALDNDHFKGDVTKQGSLGRINYDQVSGKGNVPNNQEVSYLGFACLMKPTDFLSLAARKEGTPTLPYLIKWISAGKPIGSPFLGVNFKGDVPVVIDHEGRTRMMAIREVYGNIPVLVHIFSKIIRARNLPIERIVQMRMACVPEDGYSTKRGPWFEPDVWFMGKWLNLLELETK